MVQEGSERSQTILCALLRELSWNVCAQLHAIFLPSGICGRFLCCADIRCIAAGGSFVPKAEMANCR